MAKIIARRVEGAFALLERGDLGGCVRELVDVAHRSVRSNVHRVTLDKAVARCLKKVRWVIMENKEKQEFVAKVGESEKRALAEIAWDLKHIRDAVESIKGQR